MIEEIKKKFISLEENIKNIETTDEINYIKKQYFGKDGDINTLFKKINTLEDSIKKSALKALNEEKEKITSKINNKEKEINVQKELLIDLESKIDVTIPLKLNHLGKQNVLLKTKNEIEDFFMSLGYGIVKEREIETDEYNFQKLNLAEDHPAREMQDTFYFSAEKLLRTHCTNSLSRHGEEYKNKKLKLVSSGKVYRRDDDDATHSHQFMQVDGVYITKISDPEKASLTALKTTLSLFVKKIISEDVDIRFRISYFPFTEPSVEVDITCTNCKEKGCKICQGTGYIEVLGAGIIHQKVLKSAGYDVNKYYGFAFGIGVERITMLKYNISDIRYFYLNDEKFLEQF